MTETELYKRLSKKYPSIIRKIKDGKLSKTDLDSLKDINYEFLRNKNTSEGLVFDKINDNLLEFSEGKMNTLFNEYKGRTFSNDEEIISFLDKYNVEWLKTEGDVVFNRIEVGKQQQYLFKDTEKSIVWKTSEDEKVRDSHRAMHNFTRPVNDKFWVNNGLPGTFGYNCRCYYEVIDGRRSKNKVDKGIEKEVESFSNPLVTGKVFTDKHNYFK